jgi:hypothetical protein
VATKSDAMLDLYDYEVPLEEPARPDEAERVQ